MQESSLYFRIVSRLKRYSSRFFRNHVVSKMVAENSVRKCSVISSNCIGCLFLHDLQLRFNSPTVNLYFDAPDFIRFVENLDYYLNIPLTVISFDEKRGYPVGKLDELTLYFVHYKSCNEAIEKWETRKKRVDFNNLYLICTDRNNMTEELLHRYLKLPYRKVIFVSKRTWVVSPEVCYIPGFEENGCVPEMGRIADWFGHRYYEKYFDMVAWLNDRMQCQQISIKCE